MTATPVVVSAASVLNALADDLDEFSHALAAGRIGITAADTIPVHAHSDAAARLEGFSLTGWADKHLADAAARRSLRRAAGRCALPAQTAACVAAAAVTSARLQPDSVARTALIVAGSNLALNYQSNITLAFADGRAPLPSHALTHMDADVVGAVSEAVGCRTEGWCLGASAASGTLAIIRGARMVASGEVQRCLVVGPSAELSVAELRALADSGAIAWGTDLPPSQLCRPFDTARRGFVPGSGAAALVLEAADSARARGVPALAEIAGTGTCLDGRRGMQPSAEGQERSLRAALTSAGVEASVVGYLNAHATGTQVGDACEAAAIHQVFGSTPLINSTKALIGHCMSSAGVHETIATILQLRDGFCHPNPNLDQPCHPDVSFVGTRSVPRQFEVAVKNSVGVSGMSAALVIRAPGSHR